MKHLISAFLVLSLTYGTGSVFAEGPAPSMEEQYLSFQEQLKSADNQERADAHLGIAKLYLDIMDKREALKHLELAVGISKGRKDIQKLRNAVHEEVFPTPSLLQTIRETNKNNRMFMDISFGLEGATNVTQESIQPVTPSNKDDIALVVNGLIGYGPLAKIGNAWRQNLQLSLASFLYADLKDLNLFSANFEHRLSNTLQPGKSLVSLDGYWGLGHVESDHDELLWSFNLGLDWQLMNKNLPFQPHGTFSLTQTSYYDTSFATQEGTTFLSNVGGGIPIPWKMGPQISTLVKYHREDLKTAASSFHQGGLQLRYPISLTSSLIKNVTPYVELSQRLYDEIGIGATNRRKDGKWKAGIETMISEVSNQRWTINLFTMENDSNDLVYHYRNTQLSVLYGLSL